ncbi:hypothetical protein ABZ752_22755 [Streptomyces roseifaciens]
MTLRLAITCNTGDGCLAFFLAPDGVLADTIADRARDAGWLANETGSSAFCPACHRTLARDRVLQRGDCPNCGGEAAWYAEGYRCHYCRHVIEPPDEPDDEHQDHDDEETHR